jgi:glutamine synthetase adenylyltransferase
MRAVVHEPQFTAALAELTQRSIITAADSEAIQASYDFLRRCESVLRRFENKSVSSLPNSEFEQRKLARRLGEEDLDAFSARYRSAREVIHAAYERYMR